MRKISRGWRGEDKDDACRLSSSRSKGILHELIISSRELKVTFDHLQGLFIRSFYHSIRRLNILSKNYQWPLKAYDYVQRFGKRGWMAPNDVKRQECPS